MEKFYSITMNSVIAIIVTAVVIYLAVIVFTRMAGKRSFSTISSFDFAMTVAVGSIIATTVLSAEVSLPEGVVGMGSLYLLQVVVASLRKKTWLNRQIDNSPMLLMQGDQILRENLRKARLTEGDLRSKLREKNVLQLSQVRAVVFETTGDVSVLHSSNPNQDLEEWLIKDARN